MQKERKFKRNPRVFGNRNPVRFVCPKCKHEASQQGACPGKECKKAKSQLKAGCRMSGTFPHVSIKKK